MDLSVIVVNWNTCGLTVDCVHAATRSSPEVAVEWFVIDNGSAPDDVRHLIEHLDPSRLILNTSNVGFAAAVNQGLRLARGRYVMLLNPDVVLDKGTIGHLIALMDSQPAIGAAGPLVRNQDGSIQGSARAFPNLWSAFAGRQSLLTRYFPDNLLTARNLPRLRNVQEGPGPVDWLSGACLVVRRTALESVGELDERFFMYWEDVDLCWRLRERGWQVVYDPRAGAVHQAGASSRLAPVRCTVQFHQSAYRFHRKHVTRRALHPMNAVAIAGLAARTLALAATRMLRQRWQNGSQEPVGIGRNSRLRERASADLPATSGTGEN